MKCLSSLSVGGRVCGGWIKSSLSPIKSLLPSTHYFSLSWQLTNQSNPQNMWQKGATPYSNHDEKADAKCVLPPAQGSWTTRAQRYSKDLCAITASDNSGTSYHTLIFCQGFTVLPSSLRSQNRDQSHKPLLPMSPLGLTPISKTEQTQADLERCGKRTRLHLEASNTYRYDLCEHRENNLAHTRGTEEASSLELKKPEVFWKPGTAIQKVQRNPVFVCFSRDLQLHKGH